MLCNILNIGKFFLLDIGPPLSSMDIMAIKTGSIPKERHMGCNQKDLNACHFPSRMCGDHRFYPEQTCKSPIDIDSFLRLCRLPANNYIRHHIIPSTLKL